MIIFSNRGINTLDLYDKSTKEKINFFFGRDIYSANKRDMSTQKSLWAHERLNFVYKRGESVTRKLPTSGPGWWEGGGQSGRIFWIRYKIWWRKVWCYLLIIFLQSKLHVVFHKFSSPNSNYNLFWPIHYFVKPTEIQESTTTMAFMTLSLEVLEKRIEDYINDGAFMIYWNHQIETFDYPWIRWGNHERWNHESKGSYQKRKNTEN